MSIKHFTFISFCDIILLLNCKGDKNMTEEKALQLQQVSPELRDFFHSSYNMAVEATIRDGKLDLTDVNFRQPDILSIVIHFEKVLDNRKNELSGKDLMIFNCYLASLQNTIKNRRLTMATTSLIEKLTDFIMYICIWLNSEKGYNVDLKIESRRKALEGELTKILVKSLENVESNDFILSSQPPVIRDRYGLRTIMYEDDPNLLLEVTRIILNILTNPVSEFHIEFKNWLQNVNSKFGGAPVPSEELLKLMEYSFSLSNIKDYVNHPKPSTYQSWHGTLTVDATSPNLGGLKFELQARTWEMHKNAAHGPASHDKYKELIMDFNDIFKIDNYEGGIVFYDGLEYPDLDKDGLTHAAPVLSRHISPHVIERTSPNQA